MLGIFRRQAAAQGVKLLFNVKKELQPPVIQGDRLVRVVEKLFLQSDADSETASPGITFPWLMGDKARLQ